MLILKSNGKKIKYQVLFFTRSTSTMKNVIVRNIYAVGMHHWGSHEIPLEVVHYCKWEEDNPKDNCAIAIFEDIDCTRRVAYFQRKDSSVLYRLFKDKLINGPCYLKAKQHINKFSKKKGPMQDISFGFKCSESNISLIRDITEHYERVVF